MPARDDHITKAKNLEEIAATNKIKAARTRKAPISAFFYAWLSR